MATKKVAKKTAPKKPVKKAPAKSKPNGDIGAFIQQCISLCAHLEELRTQAHLIHLNYEENMIMIFFSILTLPSCPSVAAPVKDESVKSASVMPAPESA